MRANYHMHCDFCDGKASAADMASEACARGFSIIGFSSHAPLPFETPWNMSAGMVAEYCSTIRELARRYAPSMRILVGMEIDYIAGRRDSVSYGCELDFSLAAVHYVNPRKTSAFLPENIFAVDENDEDFARHIEEWYGGNIRRFVEDYYEHLAACIAAGGFDILAHFDLLKKNNKGEKYFSEHSPQYKAAAMLAVEALEKKSGGGCIVEINTGGMARGKTDSPYPALWILRELRARGIPVCVNSDAHAPAQLTAFRDAGLRLAAEAGYTTLSGIDENGRIELPLA